jgi:hypothetical protein
MGAMSRRKGATAERAVVAWLRSLGVPADRTSRGADVHGVGDIDGIPGVVVEVKAAKSPAPATWLVQLEAEMTAAHAPRGVVMWKPTGVAMSAVGLWLAVSPMSRHTAQRVPATRWPMEAARGPVVTRVGDGTARVRAHGRRVGPRGTPVRPYRHRSCSAAIMTVLVTVAAVAGAMALVLSIAIARMDAEARRREVFRGRSCWAQAPLPTWEDALAHAETLRERGVDVQVDERLKWILIRGTNGLLHDPADGTPARRGFYPDGSPELISHWTDGYRHDPADGSPRVPVVLRRNPGVPGLLPGRDSEVDQPLDQRQAPRPRRRHPRMAGLLPGRDAEVDQPTTPTANSTTPPTEPRLYQWFYSDGTPMSIEHYTNGELVSEESFGPRS